MGLCSYQRYFVYINMYIPLALNLDMASAPGAAFIRPLLALLAELMRPICRLDAEPIAGGGVRDPEARPKGLWDAV